MAADGSSRTKHRRHRLEWLSRGPIAARHTSGG
uniref:Uncharacterized protein n=1 Tax=Arundo donax TaxID=35708 RepID=A0A0A9AVM8_ARUDO